MFGCLLGCFPDSGRLWGQSGREARLQAVEEPAEERKRGRLSAASSSRSGQRRVEQAGWEAS